MTGIWPMLTPEMRLVPTSTPSWRADTSRSTVSCEAYVRLRRRASSGMSTEGSPALLYVTGRPSCTLTTLTAYSSALRAPVLAHCCDTTTGLKLSTTVCRCVPMKSLYESVWCAVSAPTSPKWRSMTSHTSSSMASVAMAGAPGRALAPTPCLPPRYAACVFSALPHQDGDGERLAAVGAAALRGRDSFRFRARTLRAPRLARRAAARRLRLRRHGVAAPASC